MFKDVNAKFLKKQRDRSTRQLLVEAAYGDDFGTEQIPLSAEEEEAVVDVESVPQAALDKAYANLDGIVGDEDYSDEEIEELLGDMDDEDFEDFEE